MIYSYCKRCKIESPGEFCQQCGKRLSPQSQRNLWSVSARPLADGRIWRGAALALLTVTALLMLLVFGLEYIMGGNGRTANLWQGGVPRMILALPLLGIGVTFLFLALQGEEVSVYFLDKDGAHLQTWHKPSRVKSWARLQSADRTRDVPQQDGTIMHLSQERHMLWKDVQAVKYLPNRAAIRLYHTPHCAPLVLKLPSDEYEQARKYVEKNCKGK